MTFRTAFAVVLLVGAALVRAAPVAAEDAAVDVRFLTVNEGQAAIVDESMEPYFSILQPLEMVAKTGAPLEGKELAAQRDECRERYRSAVREFTDDERAAMTAAARAISAALKPAYPLFAATPWSFVKLDASIEGGMPHTRGPHIVVPSWWAAQFAEMKAEGAGLAKSAMGEVLVHEQCHVLQRARAALFADLYTNVWGLVRAKGIANCPAIERTRVVNPDGPDMGWVFAAKEGASTSWWQPMVLLPADAPLPRMPQDFRIVGVALDKKGATLVQRTAKDGAPVTMPLDRIKAFNAAFGHVPENFHPNETFAVLFSWLAMKDHLGDTGPGLAQHPNVDFAKLRTWCKAHFK